MEITHIKGSLFDYGRECYATPFGIGAPGDNLTTSEKRYARNADEYTIPHDRGGGTYWFKNEADRAAFIHVMQQADNLKR